MQKLMKFRWKGQGFTVVQSLRISIDYGPFDRQDPLTRTDNLPSENDLVERTMLNWITWKKFWWSRKFQGTILQD